MKITNFFFPHNCWRNEDKILYSCDFQLCFVGINFLSIFICNSSIIFLYVCGIQYNGFNVWNWWRIVKTRTTHDWLVSGATREKSHEEYMLEVERLKCRWHLVSGSQHGQLATWLMRCTASLFVCFFPFLYAHCKSPHYPWNCKENFREKTLEIHWRVKDCLPTTLYTFLLVFLILLPL